MRSHFSYRGTRSSLSTEGKENTKSKNCSAASGERSPKHWEKLLFLKVIRVRQLLKKKKKSRKIQEVCLLKIHPLLLGRISSVLDETGFLCFARQMTRQKPVLEAGAACTSGALRWAGNAFPKGRQLVSGGKKSMACSCLCVHTTLSHLPGQAACPMNTCWLAGTSLLLAERAAGGEGQGSLAL